MLFRDFNGNLIQINKREFTTDTEYYKKIAHAYGINLNSNKENAKDKILHFVKQKKQLLQ